MKALTDREKMALIREHGERLSKAFTGVLGDTRQDMLDATARITELVKSLPKIQFPER